MQYNYSISVDTGAEGTLSTIVAGGAKRVKCNTWSCESAPAGIRKGNNWPCEKKKNR